MGMKRNGNISKILLSNSEIKDSFSHSDPVFFFFGGGGRGGQNRIMEIFAPAFLK